ncbi:hypothetical protein [Nonomuraea soli]|uniref:Uncharacterized protein n=1 Tax=Nonomuraea soli TaxID=1032476 RepID=A0A7W0CPR3_9ACTN|nr:hypothetical protein [Nonomuraea soli]MBA2895078.1 hypothetical protein [Nonomuraea soli]
MSNGARHGLGAVAGLLLTPIVLAGLTFGLTRVVTGMRMFYLPWIGLPVLLAAAALLGFAMGSRLSPLASLLPGLAYTALGVVPFAGMVLDGFRVNVSTLLPSEFALGLDTLLYTGLMLALGLTLLVASFFPSRWRARIRPAAWTPQPYQPLPQETQHQQVHQQPPYGQPNPDDTTRPFHRE